MLHFFRSKWLFGALLPLCISNVLAQSLKPIESVYSGALVYSDLTRRDSSLLDLQNYETFLWGLEGK